MTVIKYSPRVWESITQGVLTKAGKTPPRQEGSNWKEKVLTRASRREKQRTGPPLKIFGVGGSWLTAELTHGYVRKGV